MKIGLLPGGAIAREAALAGIGSDKKTLRFNADADASAPVSTAPATGDFGTFAFSTNAQPMPHSPCSSAVATMSVAGKPGSQTARILP